MSRNVSDKRAKPTDADKKAADRLKRLWYAAKKDRAEKGLPKITQQQVVDLLQEHMGKGSQGLISQYIGGRIPLNYRAVNIFAMVIGCDPRDIRDDLPEFAIPSSSAPQDEDWPPVRATTQRLGLGSSTAIEEYAEAHRLKFRAESLRNKRLDPDHCEIAYGKGDSMLPRIHDGDAILFNRAQTEPKNRKLFVIEIDGITGQYEPQVKRCRIIGGQVYFDALNPDGDHNWNDPRPMDDKRHPIRILGQVRWIGSWED